ncbi:MAG: TonB-dependent receptor plug domain-containing protein, partial [Flavobacteriaceae bacterium]
MRILIFFCALGMSLWGYSQSTYHTLQGRVLDLTDQNPMSGAAVQLLGTDKVATTDLEGRFLMEDIVPGTYRVRIIHPFCEPLETAVDLTKNIEQEFYIEHHIHLLDEVMVQAAVLNDPNAGNSAQKIQGAQIERAQGGSLGDLISQISGVSSLKTGNNVVKPIIHGLHSSRVAMMLNGVRIQDQEWGAEHAPMVDLSALSAVTVVKGAQALRYSGDALGGVVIAQSTRPVHQDTLWGKVQASYQDNGRGYQSSLQLNRSRASGWFSNLTAGYQKQGDLQAPDYLLTNTAMEQKSWSGQWGLKKTDFGFSAYGSWIGSDLGILAASHLSGAEDQFRALSAQKPLIIRDFDYIIDAPRQAVGHGLARIDGYYSHAIWGTISGQIDYQFNQRKEFDVRRGSLKGTPALDLTLLSFNANLHVKKTNQKQTTMEYGLVAGHQSNESNPGTGVKRLIPDYQSQHYAGYLLGSQPLSDRWILDTGVRLDHQAIKGYKYYR